MARSMVLSNGELAVALDSRGLVRDLYYPYVGEEDHVRGHYVHRVGVWVDGSISWLTDSEWQMRIESEEEALASKITAYHPRLQVELDFKDIVYNESPVFIRQIILKNLADREREIKLYFGHQFEIYKSHGGDTAFFDPESHSVIHYKGRRVFLIKAQLDGKDFDDYACGRTGFNGAEGTHRDADDGQLSKNAIEHGPADSVIGLYASYAPQAERSLEYWIAAAQSIDEARALNATVLKKTPVHLVRTASDYWKAIVNANGRDFLDLPPEQVRLFKQSLMQVRGHLDNGGAFIASLDSDMLQYGYDTYSYMWPRDSAYCAMALDQAGDSGMTPRFFDFCASVISDKGYFLHKFLPDKSFGSSWHPWIKDGAAQLPIQEDETALVILAIYERFRITRDVEALERSFNLIVQKASEFMLEYRDAATGLPLPSYDLWERKRGVHTYTACATFAALSAAAELSKILGKRKHQARYEAAAQAMKDAILAHLWDEKAGMFVNCVNFAGGELQIDRTLDVSSAYGAFSFGLLPPEDPRLARAWEVTVRGLSGGIASGGLARFENDDYFKEPGPAQGNPWIITTLWYAEYLIANAKHSLDFDRVKEIFAWTLSRAQPSGVLAEQMHPETGQQVGAAPLAWAHAAYVLTVLQYLQKRAALKAEAQ